MSLHNQFLQYYGQSGRGIAHYSGHEYQRGHGFLGRVIKGGIVPVISKILPYLKSGAESAIPFIAPHAYEAFDNVTSSLAKGQPLKEALQSATQNTIDKIKGSIGQIGGRVRAVKRKVITKRRKRSTQRLTPLKSPRKKKTRVSSEASLNTLF